MPMRDDPFSHHRSLFASPCASWTTAMVVLPMTTKSRPF
jgi:hypothetical protein